MNPHFYFKVADYMLSRPTRRYCKPILHEDNVEIPIIWVKLGALE